MHLSIAELREIAARASIDPRTLEKVVRGEPVRGLAGERAREALKAAGISAAKLGPTSPSASPTDTGTEGSL